MASIHLKISARVAEITLRPHGDAASNPLDLECVSALLSSLETAASDRGAGSILLRSEGSLFSSGFQMTERLLEFSTEELDTVRRLLTFGQRSPKPLVIAVKGGALGVAVALVAGSHVALAAQGSSFALTEIRVGQWPYLGWDVIETALGKRRTLELALTGRVFNAHDALAWGLIHEITQASELDDRAFSTASLLAAAPAETISEALAWLRTRSSPVDATLQNLRSAPAREGLTAFLEKRRPNFSGSD